MKKMNIKQFQKIVKNFGRKHGPEILTGIGVTGMAVAIVDAVRSTPKALKLIEDAKAVKQEDLTAVETVKTTWKCYITSGLTFALSAGCIIGASYKNVKRNAALATAYSLSEAALREYKTKVIETIGEKKEKTITDKIAKDHIDQNPVKNAEVIITSKGESLCYDDLSGRYFKGDIDKIQKAENVINSRLLNDMYASVNDLYDELGLPRTVLGDQLGWNMDDGYIKLEVSAQISENDEPCIVLTCKKAPKYEYYRMF